MARAAKSKLDDTVVPRLKAEPKPWPLLKAWRRYRGLTQEKLAARVDMSTSSISQLEKGKQQYRQETLELLAWALSCEPGDLLMRDPTDPEGIWSVWDTLKPAQRKQAIRLIKAIADEEAA